MTETYSPEDIINRKRELGFADLKYILYNMTIYLKKNMDAHTTAGMRSFYETMGKLTELVSEDDLLQAERMIGKAED